MMASQSPINRIVFDCQKYGANIEVSKNGLQATVRRVRNVGVGGGIAITNRPLQIFPERFEITVKGTVAYPYSLAIGVAVLDPLEELPHVIYDLVSPYHFWVNNHVYIQNSETENAVLTGTCDLKSLKVGDEVGITFDGNVISLFIKNRKREQFRFKARKNLFGFVHVQGMHTEVELVSASGNPVTHTEVDVADLRAHVTHLTHNLELKALDIEEKNRSEQQLQYQLQEKQALLASTQKELKQAQQQIVDLEMRLRSAAQQASMTHAAEFWQVPRQQVILNMNNILGTGGWGYVVEGKFCEQPVAVKCLHDLIREPEFVALIRKEISIMAQIRHPNLVLFIAAVMDDEGDPLIISELLDTSLRNAYQRQLLVESSKLKIFRDVACALHYLHEHQHGTIIHRDVSSASVLLEARHNNQWKAKLSDFGSAKLAREAQTMGPGSPVYSAPEVRTDVTTLVQSSKIDVYSFGIMVCEVMISRFPSNERLPGMLLQLQERWSDVGHVVTSCIANDPLDRPAMVHVLHQIDTLIAF